MYVCVWNSGTCFSLLSSNYMESVLSEQFVFIHPTSSLNLHSLPRRPFFLPSVPVLCWAFGQDLLKPSLQPIFHLVLPKFLTHLSFGCITDTAKFRVWLCNMRRVFMTSCCCTVCKINKQRVTVKNGQNYWWMVLVCLSVTEYFLIIKNCIDYNEYFIKFAPKPLYWPSRNGLAWTHLLLTRILTF